MPMLVNGLAGRLGYQAIVEDMARLDVADEGGGGFYIIYRPRQAMSPAILDLSARLQDIQVELEGDDALNTLADVASELARALEDLVLESDLMEAPDSPLEFSYERLRRVDLLTLTALFSAVMADSKGHLSKPAGMRSPEPLNGGSSQKAQITPLKTGASRKR